MNKQTRLIIPEDIFRVMFRVRALSFDDMVRFESFNRGGKHYPHAVLMAAFYMVCLTFLFFPLHERFWATMWLLFCAIVGVLGYMIGQKENDRYYRWRLMVLDLEKLEREFDFTRHDGLQVILQKIRRRMVDTAAHRVPIEEGYKDAFGKSPVPSLYDYLGQLLDRAKSVFGDMVDNGKGYKPYVDQAKRQLAKSEI